MTGVIPTRQHLHSARRHLASGSTHRCAYYLGMVVSSYGDMLHTERAIYTLNCLEKGDLEGAKAQLDRALYGE